MKKAGFYAVANGRQIGVFLSWEECERQVKGFPGAIHKKFNSREGTIYLAGLAVSIWQITLTYPSCKSL